jgi:hypothetical protein
MRKVRGETLLPDCDGRGLLALESACCRYLCTGVAVTRCKDCGLYTVTPVARVRKAPRRGRVKDPAYLSWCAKQPCCVTGELPATTHHLRSIGSQKDDTRVVRLAKRLHLHDAGPCSIERLGRVVFQLKFGISLEGEPAGLAS